MNVFEKMQIASINFTKSDMNIYNFIVSNPADTVHLNIQELADRVKVSKSAMLRFTKKIGYSGFSEFKYEFSRYVHSGTTHAIDESYKSKYEEIINIYEKTVAFMTNTISESDIVQAVDTMLNSKRIKIFGINSTGLAVKQMRNRFHKIAFDAEAVTDPILIPELAAQGNEEDMHIFFSTSGQTEVMIEAIKNSQRRHTKTLLITANEKNKMSDYADHQILLPSTKMIVSDYYLDLQVFNFIFIELIISYLGERLDHI